MLGMLLQEGGIAISRSLRAQNEHEPLYTMPPMTWMAELVYKWATSTAPSSFKPGGNTMSTGRAMQTTASASAVYNVGPQRRRYISPACSGAWQASVM